MTSVSSSIFCTLVPILIKQKKNKRKSPKRRWKQLQLTQRRPVRLCLLFCSGTVSTLTYVSRKESCVITPRFPNAKRLSNLGIKIDVEQTTYSKLDMPFKFDSTLFGEVIRTGKHNLIDILLQTTDSTWQQMHASEHCITRRHPGS